MQVEADLSLYNWGLGAGLAFLRDKREGKEDLRYLWFWLHVGPLKLELTF